MFVRRILVTLAGVCCLLTITTLSSDVNSRSKYFIADTQGDNFLEGHVISRHYTASLLECGHLCTNNPECVSFSYKNIPEGNIYKNCHLNDAAKVDCPMDTTTREGYGYFEFSFVEAKKSQTSSKKCVNIKRKSCAVQKSNEDSCGLLSCSDYLSRNPDSRSGIYRLFITNSTESFSVFCDFQVDSVWTLVMSWKLENNQKYENKPLYENFSSKGMEVNFDDYRLSLKQMQAVKNKSFFWKMTCNFPTTTEDSLLTDMALASFQDFDILTTDTGPNGTCLPFFYINVRDYSCEPCSALFIQTQGVAPHVESTDSAKAGCMMNITGIEGEQNFGKYSKINPYFGCTKSSNSTTQIWFGL